MSDTDLLSTRQVPNLQLGRVAGGGVGGQVVVHRRGAAVGAGGRAIREVAVNVAVVQLQMAEGVNLQNVQRMCLARQDYHLMSENIHTKLQP